MLKRFIKNTIIFILCINTLYGTEYLPSINSDITTRGHSVNLKTQQSTIVNSFYVDNKNCLHIMWKVENDQNTITYVNLDGMITKSFETTDSNIKIDDLVAGNYSVTLKQKDKSSTFTLKIPEKPIDLRTISRESTTVADLTFKSFDDIAYPEFALSFQVIDSEGNLISDLTKDQFTLLEQSETIEEFDFRPPNSTDLTKIADVVVVFDDTGSMSGEITSLKNNVNDFADKLVEAGIDAKFRLISYKDDANDGWTWTDDVNTFKSHISSLEASGGNGWEEDGFEAIDIAADYDFRPGTQKVFLFITDAASWDGTDEYGKETPTQAEIIAKLKERGINLYAVAYNNSQYNGTGSITAESGGRWFPISADFSEVVNEIGNSVGGTYQLAWKTFNTDTSTIEIKVQHSSGAELIHNYTRNLPPRVFTFAPSASSRIEGNGLDIKAKALDPEGHNLIDATLLYREHRDTGDVDTWKYLKTTGDLNGLTTFSIPGTDVTEKGIDYFVWFEDEFGARGDTKIEYLEVGAVEDLSPTLNVTKNELDTEQNFVFEVTIENSGDATPEFSYQGSEKGIFVGEPEKAIVEFSDSETVYYEDLAEGKYRITLKKEAFEKSEGIIGVIKLIVKIDGVEIDGSSKEYDYPAAVELYVKRNADTIILTNFNKMSGDTTGLQTAIQDLVKKTWNLDSNNIPHSNGTDYNMNPIVIDLDSVAILENGIENPFQFNISKGVTSPEIIQLGGSNANIISERLVKIVQDNIESISNKKYLLIIGSNSIVPYGIHTDQKSWDEGDWYKSNLSEVSSLESLYQGTDDSEVSQFYASDSVYRKKFKVGRLVETPLHITNQIDNFINKSAYALAQKNAVYIGGYDHNNEEEGFLLTKYLTSMITTWNTSKTNFYNPKGFDGELIVNALNGIPSGIVSLEGHGEYNYLVNQKENAEIFDDDPFNAGRVRLEGDVTEVSSLRDTIIFSNACHLGVNFSSSETDFNSNKLTDFPEAFVNDVGTISSNRSIPIYIANTAYGRYASSGDNPAFGDLVIFKAMETLLGNANGNNNVVYDEFYKRNNLSYGKETIDDLLARAQFYGIPNYRVGPKPSSLSRSTTFSKKNLLRSLSTSSKSTVLTNSYINHSAEIKSNTIEIDLTLDIGDDVIYDSKTGKLIITGIDRYDEYNRPVLIVELPIPLDATISDTQITGQITENKNYTDTIKTENCNSKGCFSVDLSTTTFDDLARIESSIIDNKLLIRLIPIQYYTSTKESLLTTMLQATIKVTLPTVITDTDNDNLPDYWESYYGFDPRDPGGENGANGNPDEDSSSNLQEYIEQTDPLVDNSLSDDTTPPESPADLIATPRENGVNVSFTPPADAVQVQLFYGTESDKLISSSHKVDARTGTISIQGLDDATSYHIAARAYDDSANMSSASNVISFATPVGKGPDFAENPTLEGNILVVKHPSDTDFKGFHLYISDKENMENAIVTFISTDAGEETRIDLSKYLEEDTVKTIFVKIAATDDNNHEGTLSNVLKLEKSTTNSYDFDNDGDIDVVDIMKVANAWNSKLGDSNYNSAYDFNSDNKIDIKDIMLIASKWGL